MIDKEPQNSQDIQEGYIHKMKNKLFGLLREFERGREWEKFLDSILIELLGVPKEQRTINYMSLFYKLASLRYLRYEYFRTTVFDCMELFDKVNGQ
jgi:predicted methyltransferase